jgi:hypothetical protein
MKAFERNESDHGVIHHPGRARAMVAPCVLVIPLARNGSLTETTRPAIARLGQGNLTAVTLKDHLFPKVVDAPRNDASELHTRGAGWARGSTVREAMVLGHDPSMDDFRANL